MTPEQIEVLRAARARIAADREALFLTHYNFYVLGVEGGDDVTAAIAEYDELLSRIDAVLSEAS